MQKNGSNNECGEKAANLSQPMVLSGPRQFNLEALMIAREMAGFSQTELANRCEFSQAKVSRFEDGISLPSDEDLNRLSAALNVPVKFFFRSDVKRSVFNSFYRKRKSVPQKTLMQFNATICIRQVQIDRLLSKVDIVSEPIPHFDLDDYPGGVKQIAQALRQLLRLPPGPIKNLIRPLEDIGIIIVMEDFGLPKLDGVSTFTNKKTPILFLNLQAPPSRRRFTAAHELAHTALHRYMAPDADAQADALAAEFLLPANEVRADLTSRPLTLSRLMELKLRWRVSMAALIYRAKSLGVIDQRRYYYLWTQLSDAGYRVREPHEDLLEDEQPSLEREIVRYHQEELNYTLSELADSLDTPEAVLSRRYGMTHPQISIVE